MFWKRKRSSPSVIVDDDGDEQRQDYRVRVPAHMPVTLTLGAKPAPVRDLSAGGISFLASGLELRGVYDYALDFGRPPTIRGRLEVLSRDGQGHCHAMFVSMSDHDRDLLHRYVLEVQKHEIRSTREQRAVTDEDL